MENQDSNQTSKNVGKLKIFFGYAAGSGKTYEMLEAAHEAKEAGIDVVLGYIEPHARPQTMILTEGIESLEPKEIVYKGIRIKEFDLDLALKRKPELILVDELAHTNTVGSRHAKRYQDIEELLRMGINVYTTVNVQHLESLNDVVESITGIVVKERIPDNVFNRADQVELIDIEPEELIARLNAGKIYRKEQAKRALQNFFITDNLVALREIALRRTADQVNITVEKNKQLNNKKEYTTEEHILLCLSSSPSNLKIIRTAARMSEAFRGLFTAIYVRTSDYEHLSENEKIRVNDHIRLAEQLGAKIVIIEGDDIAKLIAEYAKVSSVSKIVIGRPKKMKINLFGGNFTDKLSEYAPNHEIYVIPNKDAESQRIKRKRAFKTPEFSMKEFLKVGLILVVSTIIANIFYEFGFSESNLVIVYVLAILLISVWTEGMIYSIITAVVGVLTFNYLFIEPRFTFLTNNNGYPVTFVLVILTALITSSLATKVRKQIRQSSMSAYRTEVLLETSQKLQSVKNIENIYKESLEQISKLLNKTVLLYPVSDNILKEPIFSPLDTETYSLENFTNIEEKAVATWVLNNGKHAGASTNTLPAAKCLYLAIRHQKEVFAVIAISMFNEEKLDVYEKNILIAILAEIALAIEKEKAFEKSQQILTIVEQEKKRFDILTEVLEKISIPLGLTVEDTKNLLKHHEKLHPETKLSLYEDIFMRVQNLEFLIEKLIQISREKDQVFVTDAQMKYIKEVVEEALLKIK